MTREEAIEGLRVLRRDFSGYKPNEEMFDMAIEALEQKSKHYEKHIDHTDCIWYGSGNCPVTCSQYRDGWNDAMDYIFKDGKGYQPYRHNG